MKNRLISLLLAFAMLLPMVSANAAPSGESAKRSIRLAISDYYVDVPAEYVLTKESGDDALTVGAQFRTAYYKTDDENAMDFDSISSPRTR